MYICDFFRDIIRGNLRIATIDVTAAALIAPTRAGLNTDIFVYRFQI